MENFTLRLKRVMTRGDLTMADIARLFDRERRTVASWVHDDRQPTGARARETFSRLIKLEKDVKARLGYPIPLKLSKRDRAEYVRLLGERKLERARVLAAGPPPEGVVRRIRDKD